ncbi:MAG: division/cell wall cluster transcriptional repressor MraZ [Candidatus Hydrogenedentes bacterium]|nr:division/cell wall cluster transcriptional repressor MraZ [Candidatus Hydrogenedentota bacterium]
MYFGEAATSLDEKGRITVSRKFRETMEVLGHLQWYMTRGFDGSLFLFPKEEWDKIRAQTAKYPSMDTRALGFRRMLIGSAQESRPDRQGRMVVPQHLREYAGITRDAVLIGVEDHLELWSRDRWQAYQQSQEEQFKEMAMELFEPKKDKEITQVG